MRIMRRLGWMGVFGVAAALVVACRPDDEAFRPSPGAVELGTTGIFLPDGNAVSSAPAATETPGAPVIEEVTAPQTGKYSFVVTLWVETDDARGSMLDQAFLDYGEYGLYEAPLRPYESPDGPAGGAYAQTCRDLMAQQGCNPRTSSSRPRRSRRSRRCSPRRYRSRRPPRPPRPEAPATVVICRQGAIGCR